MCTIIMISVIQGLYIVRKDENREEIAGLRERIQQERLEQERKWQRQEQKTQTGYAQQIPEYQDELAKRIEKQTEERIAFHDH